MESRAFNVELRDDNSGRTLCGYAAIFNANSVDLGGFNEVLKPGCFTKILASNKDIKCLFNHVSGQSTLGRTGVNLKLTEDDHGLYFEMDLPQTTAANDLIVLVREKIVTQCSFGFVAVKDSWTDRGEDAPLREVEECDLFEISVGVTFPAFQSTEVALRNCPPKLRNRVQYKESANLIEGMAALMLSHAL